jgi:hypothetical protein
MWENTLPDHKGLWRYTDRDFRSAENLQYMIMPCSSDRINQMYAFVNCSLESACSILGGCTHANTFVARCGDCYFFSAIPTKVSGVSLCVLLVLVSVASLTTLHTTSYCKGGKGHV